MEAIPKLRPLRLGVIGLVHTHVHWILGRPPLGDIEIVGIVEPNRDLALKYAKQHGFSMDLVYNTMEEMVAATKPEAVTAFNTIYGHLEVVQYCAPRGIHVMVEKPLAVNWEHAREMIRLAQVHGIELLTNYETSWYGSTDLAFKLAVENSEIGELQRMVFNTGHPGPVEIGVNPEFLLWLTDPELNGGGALTDFGCYGANIATWFHQGAVPESVSCITRQFKPHLYPEVEDEAIILLQYAKSQVLIQASWNWSHNRKEMEIYGTTGYVLCKRRDQMEVQTDERKGPETVVPKPLEKGLDDPFSLFHQVVRKNYQLPPYDLSSLENNRIVMQILEAAKLSAATGCTVQWDSLFPGE